MQVKLKDLKGDRTMYCFEYKTFSTVCDGDMLYKLLKRYGMGYLHLDDDSLVDVREAKFSVEANLVWIDEHAD